MAQFKFSRKEAHSLQILLYVFLLLKATRPHINNPLIYAAKAARQSYSKLRLKLKKISLKTFQNKVTGPHGYEFDLNSVVLVSPKTALNLSVRNCQWVNVVYCINSSEKTSSYKNQSASTKHRWIVLYICPDVQNDECFASPILFHNFVQNASTQDITIEFTNDFQYFMSSAFQKILVLWLNAHSSDLSPQEDEDIESSPQYASEVQVKYVQSIHYRCGSYLESLINDYFSIPKAVTVNDVLLIPVPSHLAHEFATGNSIVLPRYIFIKVSSVKGSTGKSTESQQTMLVMKGVTNLYLSGAMHCSIPPLTENMNPSGLTTIPPVLECTYNKLKSLIEMENFYTSMNRVVCRDCTEKGEYSMPVMPVNSENSKLLQVEPAKLESKQEIKSHSSVLFLGPPGCGIEEVINSAASDLGLEVLWIDAWHLKGDTSGVTEARLRQTFVRAMTQSPCVLALQNIHCVAKDSDGHEDGRVVAALREEVLNLQSDVFLVATAPNRSQVSADLWSMWTHQERIEVPDLLQRNLMLNWLFSLWIPGSKIQTLAQRTAGYIFGDFQALFHGAQRHCLKRLSLNEDTKVKDRKGPDSRRNTPPLIYEDIEKALDELQSSRSEALGAPRIPQVRWSEVGGLEDAKREVVNTIQLPLRHPSLVSSGLRRSGVLLYGPPGTGKTLLAKAVATECGLNFMSVKGPELLNMYVGQSEENVRQVFSRARAAAPCVIFFDELDSLAPNRGRSGDSGGVMDRIVSALLAELDGVASTSDVFVLAATNRPDLIDPALLRPGRFEKLVFLGVCEERAGQIKILQAVTSKVPVAEDVSLERVAAMLPLTLTGADIYALCTDALYSALQRTTQQINKGEVQEEDAEFHVTEEDFKTAAEQLVPSVTARELIHYRNLNTNKRR